MAHLLALKATVRIMKICRNVCVYGICHVMYEYLTLIGWLLFNVSLKLYCGYLYTRPCMINRILGLKQLWLQVNGRAWFHLHGSTYLFGTAQRERKIQNENICLQRDSNPRLATTWLVEQRFRPLGYDTLMKLTLINVLLDSWIKLIKPLRDNTGQSDCGYIIHVLLNWLSD